MITNWTTWETIDYSASDFLIWIFLRMDDEKNVLKRY